MCFLEYKFENLNDTCKKILDAATKVFTSKGYNGATTSEIAKEAGFSEGTIYKYFKTKKELFLSLFIPVTMEMKLPEALDSLEEILKKKKDCSEEEVMKAIFESRLDLIRKNKDILQLILYESRFHPEIRDLLINKLAIKARKILVNYIDDRKKQGKYKNVDSGVAARSLASMFAAHIMWMEVVSKYASEDEIIPREKDLDDLIKLFLYGIKVEGSV